MYFSDFDYYELYEEPLTGETYIKLEKSPIPSHFDQNIKELELKGKIGHQDSLFFGKTQHKYYSLEEPDSHLLSEKEIAVMDNVIYKFSQVTARRISYYSHKDLPYMATEDNEKIDYELVFYRDSEFSVRVQED